MAIFPSSRVRNLVWQALAIGLLAGLAAWFAANAMDNFESRRVGVGFDFLTRPANIPVGEALISYQPSDPIHRVVLVGFLNTIAVSVMGIVLATLLGTVVGLARLSPNWLAARLAGVYVEFVRNVPLLAHLFVLYVLFQGLPPLRSAISLADLAFLSNRGLTLPAIGLSGAPVPLAAAAAALLAGILLIRRRAREIHARTGLQPPTLGWIAALAILCCGAGAFVADASLAVTLPRLQGLNFTGGRTVSPELVALVAGLSLYFAAFIAEIVRGGVLAVPRGQWEAATALGIRKRTIVRRVVLPQALRLILPPLTSQYLDLAKTSSLAIAIGYPDLVAVLNSVITDTGRAIECVALIMAGFLLVNLSISTVMNRLNARVTGRGQAGRGQTDRGLTGMGRA